MLKPLVISAAALLVIPGLNAQEIVTGLISNAGITSEWVKREQVKGAMVIDTLELPFFDDFSGKGILPDGRKWEDKYVFINNTYTVKQRTSGVATFDAIDKTGRLYETASATGFEADKLTSVPVNLEYFPTDNIYLSFLYEPGGVSDIPESKDSLTLQFFAPLESKWYSVWQSPLAPADTFRTVIIPLNNSRFLKKGFKFRFINYASINTSSGDPSMAANCDIWNLDYVLLGKNRNSTDTIFTDVAFTKPIRSTLNTYESMPLKQFSQIALAEMGDWITIHYRNNDVITRNVTRNFEIFDVYRNAMAWSFSAGAANIPPGTAIDYNADLLYSKYETSNNDSALFRIKSYLITDVFDPKSNDTIIYYQKFSNYFAYDDGTAEAGYGINGLGSKNAMVACRFKSFMKDTLRAIQVCFNDSYQNANLRDFNLMVWSNNLGVPENILLTQEEVTAAQGITINGFHTYYLDNPIELNGDFFIGWKQLSETFLNVGFDLNTPPSGKQLYWINGEWNVSQQPGTIMIRPVFGPAKNPTSIEQFPAGHNSIQIWPNPARDYINLDINNMQLTGHAVVRIRDIRGREVLKTDFNDQINVSSLAPGLYIIIIEINNVPAGYSRLVKPR